MTQDGGVCQKSQSQKYRQPKLAWYRYFFF